MLNTCMHCEAYYGYHEIANFDVAHAVYLLANDSDVSIALTAQVMKNSHSHP